MPLDQLRGYLPERHEPAGFEDFWRRTLAEARGYDLGAEFVEVDADLTQVRCFDVTFAGFGGHPIRGWFLVPAAADGPLPCVVEFIGYGGGRGLVTDHVLWPSAGWAVFVMDSRGQGRAPYAPGDTADPVGGTGPAEPGHLTQGVLNPEDYYYRRFYTDGVRAVEAARSHPLVDASRIVVRGGSQGGGAALAVSSLMPGLAYAFIDVPFMTGIRRAIEITDEDPYGEIGRLLSSQRGWVEQVLNTLDYVDGVNFAARNTTPALFSVALRDGITPPSTVFAGYNHYAGPKDILVWPYNGHEGGGAYQRTEQLRIARTLREKTP